MSDDLVKRAAALVEKEKAWNEWEYPSQPAPPAMVQGEVATLVSDMADEITRRRAWRDAINGYLTEAWNSPLRDDEAPLAALKRLIKLELTAMALDPEIHKAMNAALATARRDALAEIKQDTDELIEQGRQDGMEQAAQIAADFETVAYQHGNLPANDPHECAAQAAREIAAAIRVAAGEVKL